MVLCYRRTVILRPTSKQLLCECYNVMCQSRPIITGHILYDIFTLWLGRLQGSQEVQVIEYARLEFVCNIICYDYAA
jgi:hypothetical protein